jgi:hypothetical protein
MRTRNNGKPRRIDLISDDADHACAFFGAIGMSTKFITKRTGLTPSQISYRLKKGGFTRENGASRMDYRNGDSPFSLAMMDVAKKAIDDKKESKLIKFLNDQMA